MKIFKYLAKQIKVVFAAFAFLTIIPIKSMYEEKTLGRSCAYFPFVGFILGIATASFALLHIYGVSTHLIAAAVIILPQLLTGGLHFDALMDSADGLYGYRSLNDRLRIMRDSQSGAIGVLSAVCVVIMKYSLIMSMPAETIFYAVIGALTFSRFVMTVCCCFLPYAREEGKAEAFTRYAKLSQFITAALITALIFYCFFGISVLAVLSLSALLTSIFIIYAYNKIKGVTGDTIGASSEIAETAFFFAFYTVTVI